MKIARLSEILQQLDKESYYWQIGFYGLVTAMTSHALFMILFMFLDVPILVAINLVSVGIYLYCIFVLGLPTLKNKDDSIIGWLVYGELIGSNFLATWLLGKEAGFQFYFYIPAMLPFFINSYSRIVYFLRLSFIILLALWVETSPLFNYTRIAIDPIWLQRFHWLNLLIFLLIISALSYLYALKEQAYSRRLIHDLSRDPLTGLYNRRILDEILQESQQNSSSTGLLLLDVDHFKQINDRYGHECGDQVLKKLAEELTTLYFDEKILRWGGEEFLIVVPGSDSERIYASAERVRTRIESLTVPCGESLLAFSVTVGATLFRGESESFRDALVRTDEALYHGKKKGRNCCIVLL